MLRSAPENGGPQGQVLVRTLGSLQLPDQVVSNMVILQQGGQPPRLAWKIEWKDPCPVNPFSARQTEKLVSPVWRQEGGLLDTVVPLSESQRAQAPPE